MPRPICFHHLRKTGGTTLIAMIDGFVPPHRCLSWQDWPEIQGAPARPAEDWLFVHGHADMTRFAPSGAFTFTVVREPLERLKSERRQWTQAADENIATMSPAGATATRAFRHLPLAAILDRVFDHPVTVSNFWNHQTAMLGAWPLLREQFGHRAAGDRDRLPIEGYFPGPAPETRDGEQMADWLHRSRHAILDLAIGRLRSLDYVGVQERFEESTREIFARLGLPEPGIVPRLNARDGYPDENDAHVAKFAAPFLELDYALHEEARILHARAGRAGPAPRSDYIGRSIGVGEHGLFGADEAPGGHGWHRDHLGVDGRASRWTGPSCVFASRLEPGRHRLELTLFGAVSEAAVLGTTVVVEGLPARTGARPGDDGRWRIVAEFDVATTGLHDLRFDVPGTIDGHGLEIASIGIASVPVPDVVDAGDGGLERATAALASMDGENAPEGEIARAFGAAVRDVVVRLAMPDLDRWRGEDACVTADDMFAAFADAIATASALADVAESRDRPWETQARLHATYALRWLADVAVPPIYRPLYRRADALVRGTPAFEGVVWEAAVNLARILVSLTDSPPATPSP